MKNNMYVIATPHYMQFWVLSLISSKNGNNFLQPLSFTSLCLFKVNNLNIGPDIQMFRRGERVMGVQYRNNCFMIIETIVLWLCDNMCVFSRWTTLAEWRNLARNLLACDWSSSQWMRCRDTCSSLKYVVASLQALECWRTFYFSGSRNRQWTDFITKG